MLKIGVVIGVLFGIISGVLVNSLYYLKSSLVQNYAITFYDILTLIISFGLLILLLYLLLSDMQIGK